jgi:hypothetical protein
VAGHELLVPKTGLTAEVLLEVDTDRLGESGEALVWLSSFYESLGWVGMNLALHREPLLHLHVRPAPTRQSGLEDALGMSVTRLWGPALLEALSQFNPQGL